MRAEKTRGTNRRSVETLKPYKTLKMRVVNWTNKSDVLTTSGEQVREFNTNWLDGFENSNLVN